MNKNDKVFDTDIPVEDDISRFTDSYASFNRIMNSLQRKYIELQDEFSVQNDQLASANKRLVQLSKNNIAVTEFLNNLLCSITAGVIAVNTKGIITQFNPAASAIFGIPLKEPLGVRYESIIPAGNPENCNAMYTLRHRTEVDSVEKKVELADGGEVYISLSTALISDSEGNIVGAAEVFQDLTKIKKMEIELARLNTLAALGEMAATIAHEVRNPLAAIAGFASLLERDMNVDDPKLRLIEKIKQGTDNLNSTVETLLNYTRFEELNKKYTDFIEFVNIAVTQFKNDNIHNMAEVKINVDHTHIKESKLNIEIDSMLFRQIFFNIFINAIDAFDMNGEINICIKKLPRQKAIADYGDKLMLGIHETIVQTTISDNGSGIPEDKIDKIFAPFYTTKASGNGLGLAVAWKIIKAHGGEIYASNLKDSGAAFSILMPVRIKSEDS